MLKCPVCNSEFQEGTRRCVFCGTVLISGDSRLKQADTDIQKKAKTDSSENRKNTANIGLPVNSRQEKFVIGVIAVGVIILLVYETVSLSKKSTDNYEDNKVSESNQGEWNDKVSMTDIDGAGGKRVTLYGTLQHSGAGWELLLEDSVSFLAEDIYGDTMYVEPQTSVTVETDKDLNLYEQCQVRIKGMVTAIRDTSSIIMKVEEIETMGEPLYDSKEGGIHRYEYVRKDCTWQQAFDECKSKGGYLVRINSEEEYQCILNEIQSHEMGDVHFFMGGRRASGGTEYYWVDEGNQLYGDRVDSNDYWCRDKWMNGEPSLRDNTINVEEDCLDIFYYKDVGGWVWNDVPNDILGVVPTYSGKIGYICEYEG